MRTALNRVRRVEMQSGGKIERDFVRNRRGRLRIVVCRTDRALSLETARCQRTLTASGSLTEVVRLDGTRGALSDEDLEKFVQSFPVERI